MRLLAKFIAISTTLLLAAPVGALEAERAGGVQDDPRAGETPTDAGLSPSVLSALGWRNLGPAVTGGRVVDFAVDLRDRDVIYAATASGGLWKTTNHGVTWDPVFDDQTTVSLGAVTLAPSNPNVVWVGTGEPNNQRSSSWGDGVYKSEDGGGTWEHMGLETTRHVGAIVVHPEDEDIVYVAGLGSLWGSGGERGLYVTTDGGDSWDRILEVDEHTGAVDLAMDPRDPNLLYAATYQRQRRNWSFVGGGPGSGIWRSRDGGDTWEELDNGLPSGDLGKIGLSICASRPDTVYATVQAGEDAEGGIYRSDDRGASWQFRNSINQTPWYYSEIRCDPNDSEVVYTLGTILMRSDNGGADFERLQGRSVHVDHHALWIDPADSGYLLLGNDGGIYVSRDRGDTWEFHDNLSITQFYTVAVDLREPFYSVYGGTQDNNTWGGPSGTRNAEGILNSDWYVTVGGDGFYAQIDPEDTTIVYSESQYGNLVRFDTETGERKRIQPADPDGEEHYRWNWSAPLLISEHDPATLYFAANVVFKSTDRGDSWEVVSPDLTRQLDRDELPLMGQTWGDDAISRHEGTSEYGNITTLSESPLEAGVLAAGTDDGLIQLSRDDGETWREIPSESLPGLPELSRVSRIRLSHHAPDTIYATFDRHKDDDFRPYVYVSRDFGDSWTEITGDLPEFGSTRVITEHPRDPGLLFVGTEFGTFFSATGGDTWTSLELDMPTVSVHDIAVHPRDNDLVLGTHGRGFWVLDDIAILEELPAERIHLAPVRPALQFHEFRRGFGSLGDGFFSAANPPRGALLTYWIDPEVMAGGDGPGNEADKPSPPTVRLDLLDADGDVVRRLEAPQGRGGTGVQRVVWDLRYEPPFRPRRGAGSGSGNGPAGPFVMPGIYTARLQVGDAVSERPVRVDSDRLIDMSAADRQAWHDAMVGLMQLQESVRAASATAQALDEQLGAIVAVLKDQPDAPEELTEEAEALAEEVERVMQQIDGDRDRRPDPAEPPPISRLVGSLYGSVGGVHSLPTADQRRLTRRAHERLGEQVEVLNRVIEEDLPALNRRLDEAGVPWTPGRTIRLPSVGTSPYGE